MNRSIILPLFALALVLTACQIQSAPPIKVSPSAVSATEAPRPPVPGATPVPSARSGLMVEMLKNGTYHTPAYNRTFTLVNGAYSSGSGTDAYSVQMLEPVAFGDLNGDGDGEAAIILAENGGGSGTFETLVAVLAVGGEPTQAGQARLGDRVRINSLAIESGKVIMDALVQGPNDPMCCPSLPETQSYRLIGNTLWLTRLTSHTPDDQERSITINTPADGAQVTNPFTVSGSVSNAPFENTLAYRLYLPDGTKVNESPLPVDSGGRAGGPGTFSQTIDLGNAGISGPVMLQYLDLSAADGSTLALGSVEVTIH